MKRETGGKAGKKAGLIVVNFTWLFPFCSVLEEDLQHTLSLRHFFIYPFKLTTSQKMS
ncbi:MAG: hypothetical protein OXH36_05245 [Bdellovibrionales bacterium]|nr:hypothetical protein [Bdellovibrionales bacterium]